ncbi:MAG: lipopolysaccharide heptosyltransferase I [Burkholderiaceae bacterium]|nr:lipopolysaccharide heptosyltransferase I [Burkholderiaceae bacterium]MCD8517897.1 lipopolysaccharide heptosyltransferase I [Burkholderiaceae bacterium]MCD8536515.1 lipopolysaccharide heptosyltransferase I [Burkholderiaceae bacterium]MCD8565363.1 lipopolysaccharide heptosyltransferase I [Burkholderiaceae bacterium]
MRVLIVRTSSLGDLVHMLPAISDIAARVAGVTIDWVVEEAFSEIPGWHPAVNEVITVAHRRWRKAWLSRRSRTERAAVLEKIRDNRYDLVLDMQALLKSIWLVRAASGIKHGLDWRSAREPLCSLFYDERHHVEFWQPAVLRQRQLAAAAFAYQWLGEPDFGLQRFAVNKPAQTPYAVIMPSASREDKLWPSEYWQAVFDRLQSMGMELVLLAGNEQENARAAELLQARDCARVQPRSTLTELAQLMAGARIMVGLDSGLTHLSAALGIDTIGIYKASTPVRTPLVGSGYTASLGDRGKEPTVHSVLVSVDAALTMHLNQ